MLHIQTRTSLPDSAALRDFFDRLHVAPASTLLLDYDGTLAPFQIDRNDAYPYPGTVQLLERVLQCGNTRIVIITGRPVADLKPFLRPLDHLEIWGAHGLEHQLPDGNYEQMHIHSSTLDLLSRAKEWVLETKLASSAEFKPGGIAMHWRGLSAAEARKVEVRVRDGWTPLALSGDLKLLNFESGVELRVVHPDKGDAVASIIRESTPQTEIAYLGDDLTDEDSFRVLNGRGLTVLVRSEYRETAAKVWLQPPRELIGFLERWLKEVSKSRFND